MKKRVTAILMIAMAAALLCACTTPTVIEPEGLPEPTAAPIVTEAPAPTEEPAQKAEPVELVVFAAASMTEAMNQIAELYKEAAPHVTLVFNFDSSGTLKTQIEEGADCDIFISAGKKQMDQLDISADAAVNTDGLDFVLQGSRFNIVENLLVMIVPEGAEKDISSFEDALSDKVDLIALGNSDVPAGQYAQEVYTYLGLWDQLVSLNKISYGTNVKEVLELVKSASVDCGVVYSTDAATATGVTVVAYAPAGSHKPIVYPAAIMNATAYPAEAETFMAFLRSEVCAQVFRSIGFGIPAN